MSTIRRAKTEIDDTDILYRRIPKNQINEKGIVSKKAFELRLMPSNEEEAYLSFTLSKLTTAKEAVLDLQKFSLCEITAGKSRELKLGVAHSPSNNIPAHTAICGFFNDSKVNILAQAAEIIEIV